MTFKTVNFREEIWQPSKTGITGRYAITGHKEEREPELVCFAKLDPHTHYARIRAKALVHYYVIRGVLLLDDCAFEEGAYVRVESGREFTPSSLSGCEVFCVYTGGYDKVG